MLEQPTNAKKATVLVVDDSPQNLSLMSGVLEDFYTVKLAPSGARALKIAGANPLDLILLDIMMPEMDGYEVCTQLKANPATAGIPVIFLTAMDTMQDEEKGLAVGAVDYITKPISPAILMARVRNQILLKDTLDRMREQNQLLEQERNRTRELLARLKQASDKLIEQNRQLARDKARVEEELHGLSMAQGSADGSVTSELALDRATQTLGRYRIERELGRGAMGTVYLGSDPAIGRVVAIKTMNLASGDDEAETLRLKQQFFREAESAGRLTHPNIVAVYDVGEQGDLAYIAMEFLRGKDLAARTQPGQLLPVDTVLAIGAQVAEALAYAHAQGIVHRDIKPANIVYEPDSESVKVTDFGIAGIASAFRAEGAILGTPSYMSPEQAGGFVMDGRSDLYSLGVTLFAMVCGRLPFRAESLEQLLHLIAHEAPPDIRQVDSALPDCVASLLAIALAKRPDQRFADGETMARALRQCRRSLTPFAT